MGVFVAAATCGGILMRPLLGRLIDRRGCRIAFAISGLLNVVGFVAYLPIDSLGPRLLAVRLLHGVGAGGLFVTFFTAASNLLPPGRRARGIALFGISGMAAAGVGPALGEAVLRAWGFSAMFVALGALAAISLAITLRLGNLSPRNFSPGGASTGSAAAGRLGARIHDAGVLRVLVASMIFGFGVAALFTFVPAYADLQSLERVSTFFVAYASTSIALRLVASGLPDRIGYVRTVGPTLLALATACVWFGLDATARGLVVAGVIAGSGHAFAFPALTALVLARTDPAERGLAVSAFTIAFDVGALVAAPTLGLVAGSLGYPTAFATAAIVVAGGIAAFLTLEAMAVRRARLEAHPRGPGP